MEPLLCQVSLARENPTHLPGHSQHAPALASARVCLRRLPIAVQTCLCDSPNNPGAGSGRATGPVLATPQRSRPRGVPGPFAPPCPLGAHGAGRPVPGRGARYSQSRPGPATRLCLAHSQRVPAVPSGRPTEPGPKVPRYALAQVPETRSQPGLQTPGSTWAPPLPSPELSAERGGCRRGDGSAQPPWAPLAPGRPPQALDSATGATADRTRKLQILRIWDKCRFWSANSSFFFCFFF